MTIFEHLSILRLDLKERIEQKRKENKILDRQFVITANIFIVIKQNQKMRNLPHLQVLNDIRQLPVKYEKRSCTDIFCIIFASVLGILFFILALALFNFNHFYRANFPSDSEGRLCGMEEQTAAYPYVYFVDAPEFSRRVCVKQCPISGQTRLQCRSTKTIGCAFSNATDYEVIYYQNQPIDTRSGYFCMPTDQNLKQELMQKSGLMSRDKFYKSIDTIYLSFYVSFAFYVAYLLAVQFFPRQIVYPIIGLGAAIILACIICIIVYPGNAFFKLVEILILSLFFVIIVAAIAKKSSSLKLYSVFLHQSTKLVKERPIILIYIPLFFIFLVLFVILVVFQFTAFWTSGSLTFNPQLGLFYELQGAGPVILSILLAIQTIWGFTFIKTAFNFCISAIAVGWYYGQQVSVAYPFKLMLAKHLGSVIGGSFIVGFLTIFDYILDFFQPSEQSVGCYASCYKQNCKRIFSIFDLVREDAISFVVLTANPFCNSARFCQYLCKQTVLSDQNQATSRSYRISAHLLLVGIMIIFALYVKGNIPTAALVIVGVLALISSSLFISLHCDIAEAIQIILLADEELSRRAKNIEYLQHNEEAVKESLKDVCIKQEFLNELIQLRVEHIREREQRIGGRDEEDDQK